MSKNKLKQPKIRNIVASAVIPEISKNATVSLALLHKMRIGSLLNLIKECKHELPYKIDEPQEFLFNLSNFPISDALTHFVSRNGSKLNDKNNLMKKIKDEIRKNMPEYEQNIDDIIHVHGKFGGKGSLVLFGFRYHDNFNVVYIDPYHSY
jgi:dsDNA-specific endonuclease/ATPase MutS2